MQRARVTLAVCAAVTTLVSCAVRIRYFGIFVMLNIVVKNYGHYWKWDSKVIEIKLCGDAESTKLHCSLFGSQILLQKEIWLRVYESGAFI